MSFLHVALLGQCTGRTQVSRGYCIVPLLRQYLCRVVLYPFSADVLTYNIFISSFLSVQRMWQCTGRTHVLRGYCIVLFHRQYLCHVVLYPFSADVLT